MVSQWILVAAVIVCGLALVRAVMGAQWAALRAEPLRMHLVAGGAVCCLLLWLLNIHLLDGLVLHFLGITTLTLLVGWSFAVLGATVALVGFYSLLGLDWMTFGLSACLTVLVPATLSRLLAQYLYRPTLKHPFVYILGAGFAGGGLVVLAIALCVVAVFWLSGLQGYVESALQWSPLLLLIMFSEGFINGMCVAALAIFYPHWVKTFDDRFYLDDT